MGNEQLQNAILNTGLTIEGFAEVIRVDPKSVGRWVAGTTTPYPRHRQAIARALDLDEHDLWPEHTPAPATPGPGQDPAAAGCDVIGSWAYSDQESVPDLVDLITHTDGPIDMLDNHPGIEMTDELAGALAAQAAAGRETRILTSTPTTTLSALAGQQQIEVRLDRIRVEFSFLRAGQRMLFTINFQDDTAALPPPVLELTATITGGLFERALNKFEELWQQAGENPGTLLTTPAQLDTTPAHTNIAVYGAAGQDQQPGAAYKPPMVPPRNQAPATPPSPQAGERSEPPKRRWPGRAD